MPFSTTIAGSLPKPAWLAEPERIFPSWRLEGPDLADAQRDATRIAVFEQLRAGIETVTDGEQSRRHFVHGFAERLGGVDALKRQSRGIRDDRYDAVCPTVTGEVRRTAPIHVAEMRFARSLTDAFVRSNAMFDAAQRNFPYVSPWLDCELEETEALMGTEFFQDGYEHNRTTIETFCQQAFDLGITKRRVTAEDYFAEFLES